MIPCIVGLIFISIVFLLTTRNKNTYHNVIAKTFKVFTNFAPDHDIDVVPDSSTLNLLEDELREILLRAEKERKHKIISRINMTCKELKLSYKLPECDATGTHQCLREFLPRHPRERIKSILFNERLRIKPQHRKALEDLGKEIDDHYDVIIVSSVSSNHYLESQAMLKNLHEDIFPILSNFTLVVYDIGLSDEEHKEYQRYCRCTLIKYPFHVLPSHFKTLKCFGWKPVAIRAHLDKAKFIIWQDASVRYLKPKWLLKALHSAEIYGVQQRDGLFFVRNPFRSLAPVFHFFGDTPCAHLAFTQAQSNWGIYRNSPLVKTAILDSWVACGLNISCSCPVDPFTVMHCPEGKQKLGTCLRPQAVVALLLSKLYMEHYYVALTTGNKAKSMAIKRDTVYNYFDELKQNKT